VLPAFQMLAASLHLLAFLLASEIERRRTWLVRGWKPPGKTSGRCQLFRMPAATLNILASFLTSEVERRRAWLVLGRGTAWEDLRVLSAFRMLAACLNLLACMFAIDQLRNQCVGPSLSALFETLTRGICL
jgi:hypothetical protein